MFFAISRKDVFVESFKEYEPGAMKIVPTLSIWALGVGFIEGAGVTTTGATTTGATTTGATTTGATTTGATNTGATTTGATTTGIGSPRAVNSTDAEKSKSWPFTKGATHINTLSELIPDVYTAV